MYAKDSQPGFKVLCSTKITTSNWWFSQHLEGATTGLPLKGALNVYYRITCAATRKQVNRITPNAIRPFVA